MRNLKLCHSAENVKGVSMGFYNIQFAAKYQKKLKGGPFGDFKKTPKKSLTVPKTNQKEDPLVSSAIVKCISRAFWNF